MTKLAGVSKTPTPGRGRGPLFFCFVFGFMFWLGQNNRKRNKRTMDPDPTPSRCFTDTPNWLSQVQPRFLGEQPKNLQGSRRPVIGLICTWDGFGFFK